MHTTSRPRRSLLRLAAVLVLTAAWAGCSLEDQSPPNVLTPSEFALSIVATATPDQLPRDGNSQSVVTLTVRDDQGRPVSGQRLTLSLASGTASGAVLSQGQVVTGSDGRASFAVVAPPQTSVGSNEVRVGITPVGGNFDNAVTRTISIALTGVSNTSIPTPAFTVSPPAPETDQTVTFDASGTTDEGTACRDACTYAWNFDDGNTATGRVVTHRFTAPRNYTVALDVRDAAGSSASLRQVVIVARPQGPIVSLAVSPNPPILSQQATFTANATAAVNHSIVRFDWDFGDGTSQSTTASSVTKTYTTAGSYVATVRATDDLGQTGSASLAFTLGSGITFQSQPFTFSPTNPRVGDSVSFNASTVTTSQGATITSYAWDFGDGSSTTTTSPTTSHTFSQQRTFIVRLTVTDSLNRTGSATQNVVVAAP